jgi:polar amino acid transport system substrate-binding protein
MRVFANVLLTSMLAVTTAAGAQTIQLVTEDAYPFQHLEQRQLTGMAVEVVAEMFKRAGVPHNDELLSWKDAYDRAQLYPNTCIYSTARTENRERLFKWVGPIVENKWAAFAKKGFKGRLAAPADFKDYRIGVLKGDAKERYLQDLAVTFRTAESDDAANPPKLTLNRTEPGKIDLWVTGYYTGAHVAKKTGVGDIVPVWVFQTSPNYLACHPGTPADVLRKLQAALEAMNKDGGRAAIVARYEQKLKGQ